ncbi:MAG: endolytic transglycosylase MltG [candidate division Zixibacteria bacterium]|nr:endolytic transglycosylase MltG [candidate division Zixibacteria bacterium]
MRSQKLKSLIYQWIVYLLSSILIFLSSLLLLAAALILNLFRLIKKLPFFFKKKTRFAILLSSIAVLLLLIAYIFFYPLGWEKNKDTLHVMVEKGDNFPEISRKLKDSGLRFNSQALYLSSVLLKIDRKIFPGRYDFQKGITLSGVLKKFYEKGISAIDVTIPEGYNLYQIAGILKKEIDLDSVQFVKTCFDTGLIRRLGLKAKSLEGYLFPDTYKLYWKMEPGKIIEMMVQEFNLIITDSLRAQLNELKLSLHKVLTVASLVESEAKIDEERPLISAVYYNRLKIGMALQCDPTVIYALGGLDRPLVLKDLEIDSPYNTYKHPGLPPGPINNPGKASLIAAFFPAKIDYLYFVAKGDGSHFFSVDLEEHNRARAKIKRENKS